VKTKGGQNTSSRTHKNPAKSCQLNVNMRSRRCHCSKQKEIQDSIADSEEKGVDEKRKRGRPNTEIAGAQTAVPQQRGKRTGRCNLDRKKSLYQVGEIDR